MALDEPGGTALTKGAGRARRCPFRRLAFSRGAEATIPLRRRSGPADPASLLDVLAVGDIDSTKTNVSTTTARAARCNRQAVRFLRSGTFSIHG